ncbi:hypothetical protein CKALI_08845 [Corynebacterium kalinowskii]|uniref:Uncharacterized protein n=1 Tax=Corynebacterium kalinowskii TaxID=2675216 RepID=A0A6B8VUJ4_9CORY|nr:hypothetical protein [Corynebacterium kalinowskii]QGU02625.1 hypothetical protein CKALI_08845 [Corynebacterium kalinowskii]
METRKFFIICNAVAVFVAPLIVLFGRFAGGNAGWLVVIFLFGGFLAVSGGYLILLLVGLMLGDGRSRFDRSLKVLWWFGAAATTFAMWLIPDAGDAPNSETVLLDFGSMDKETAIEINSRLSEIFGILGVLSFFGWILLCIVDRVRRHAAHR